MLSKTGQILVVLLFVIADPHPQRGFPQWPLYRPHKSWRLAKLMFSISNLVTRILGPCFMVNQLDDLEAWFGMIIWLPVSTSLFSSRLKIVAVQDASRGGKLAINPERTEKNKLTDTIFICSRRLVRNNQLF